MATTGFRLPNMPFFLQRVAGSDTPILYTAAHFRNYTAANHRRSGILGPTHFRVVQSATVGWSVDVKSGFANVGGFYIVLHPADTSLSVPSTWKPSSGTVRHRVFLVVFDELVAGSDSYAELQVIQDFGSGAPTPSGAAAYLELATVAMTSTQSNIQDANIANKVRHGGSAFEKVDMDLAGYLRNPYQPAVGDGHTGPFLQYDNGVVRLSGRLSGGTTNFTSGSASANTDLIIGDLPTQYRPVNTRSLVGTMSKNLSGGSSLYFYRMEVMSDGKMVARIPTGQTVEYITLDNMFYTIDAN
jgi:hypothetical protein